MPRSIYRRDYLPEYNECMKQLRLRYIGLLASPDGSRHRSFLPGRAAQNLLHQDVEAGQLAKKAYLLYRCSSEQRQTKCWGIPISLFHRESDNSTIHNDAHAFLLRLRGILSVGPGEDLSNDSYRSKNEHSMAKLFAIIVLSEPGLSSQVLTRFIQHVMSEGSYPKRLCDRHLPFLKPEDIEHWFGSEPASEDDRNRIWFRQWTVCPVVINHGRRLVHDLAPMPYYAEEAIRVNENTGLGVWRVQIDSHFFHGSIPSGWVACKEIEYNRQNEEHIGRRLEKQMRKHTHIREAFGYAKFQCKTSVYMEYAECSLEGYMQKDLLPTTTDPNKKARWLKKILGPAHALIFLHQEVQCPNTSEAEPICHMDIKPDNLVWVKTREGDLLLKVSDFGMSCVVKDGAVTECPNQISHCAPENFSGLRPVARPTTSADSWGFGSTALEYAVWIADGMGKKNGQRGLTVFRDRLETNLQSELGDVTNRRFYIIERDQTRGPEGTQPERQSDSWDFHSIVQTDGGRVPVVMKLNPAIRAYFEEICGDEDKRSRQEKKLLSKFLEVLLDTALVPNPVKRSDMATMMGRLAEVLDSFGKA